LTRLGLIKARLLGSPPAGISALACVSLTVALPTAIRASIDHVVSNTTFVTYSPFILVSALFMNWRHVAVVTVASALTANFLFMEPRYTFLATVTDTVGTLLFVVSSALVILVGQTLRRTVRQLEEARDREAHLNRELQHRVKNTLAVVQGLASQTFRNVTGSDGSLEKLHGRIRALAEANDILRDGRWEECKLPELAIRALEPFNARGAIHLRGPACTLPEESCVPLVLAFHELATNAVKYGALSANDGSIDVSWDVTDPVQGKVTIRWQERDGPIVQTPVRKGLGSKLLRAQAGLDAVSMKFASDGVICDLSVTGVKLSGSPDHPLDLPLVTFYSADSAVAAN
jgi:two-component sensor histidine kinase